MALVPSTPTQHWATEKFKTKEVKGSTQSLGQVLGDANRKTGDMYSLEKWLHSGGFGAYAGGWGGGGYWSRGCSGEKRECKEM